MMRPSPRLILFGVLAFILVLALFMVNTSGTREAPMLTGGKAVERSTLSSDGFLSNSKFVVTRQSRSYEVNTKPKCWKRYCDKVNNWLAFSSCDSFSEVATEWNSIGVRTMERYVGSTSEKLEGLSRQMLLDAVNQFANASSAAQDRCWAPLFNGALVKTNLGDFDGAAKLYEKALEVSPTNELQAIVHLHWGLNEEVRFDNKQGQFPHYDKVRALDVNVEKDYWGVATTAAGRKGLSGYGPKETATALKDFTLHKHFAAVSIAQYSLLPPGTQDAFIQNRYTVFRHTLPPFVLAAAQKCFADMIASGQVRKPENPEILLCLESSRLNSLFSNLETRLTTTFDTFCPSTAQVW